MKQGNVSELDAGGTLRCGRCADILPDETLTFCKSCGAPFSQAHPTESYVLLSDRRASLKIQTQRNKTIGICASLMLSFWMLFGLAMTIHQNVEIQNLRPKMRELKFYFKDFSSLPELDSNIKREAIFISLRAFEDHFGLQIKDVSFYDDQWPAILNPVYSDTEAQLAKSGTANSDALFAIPSMRLSFWENQVFPAMNLAQIRGSQSPLNIVISNLPIFAKKDSSSQVETRHLAGAGLVSGLGHPGLVFVSTYRLHNEVSLFHLDRPDVENFAEKARYVGEYAIAHELGHALLGLTDYVTPPEAYSPLTLSRAAKDNPNKNRLARKIASLDEIKNQSSVSQCLMHTDKGGGSQAWANLKRRELGLRSDCSKYEDITRAFSLRFQAIEWLKAGDREGAEQLHSRALELAKPIAQEWLVAEWKKEHQLFLSFFRRLSFSMFMVQSRDD